MFFFSFFFHLVNINKDEPKQRLDWDSKNTVFSQVINTTNNFSINHKIFLYTTI